MKAIVWQGVNKVGVENVPDPTLLLPTDAIVKITSTAICGSDLHLLDGFIPSMEKGDILGHEFMGEVVEVGKAVKKLKVGDRVVVDGTDRLRDGASVRVTETGGKAVPAPAREAAGPGTPAAAPAKPGETADAAKADAVAPEGQKRERRRQRPAE